MLRTVSSLSALLVFAFMACSQAQQGTPATGTYKTIPAKELQTLQATSATLTIIDVRTPGEVAQGKIKGARNINVNASDFSAQLEKLDKSKPVAVYCVAGVRSARAMDLMKRAGFTTIYNLEGGIKAWGAAGFPVVKE